MATAIREHPGTKHKTVQNPDGSWNILDVAIMAPVPKGARMNDEDIGEEWMRAAIRVAETDLRSGHLGSLSIGHHPDVSIGVSPKYAGKILPRRVGTATMEGKEVPALFADFLFVPTAVKDAIKRHELSYRSPEVVSWAKFRVDNVSLLSTEPPFFRLSSINIGTEVPFVGGSDQSTYETAEQFASAFFAAAPTGSYRLSREIAMKFADDGPPAGTEETTAEAAPAAVASEEQPVNVRSVVQAIKAGTISVADLEDVAAAIASLGAEPAPAPAEPETPEAEPMPDPNAQAQPQPQQQPRAAGKPEPVQMQDVKSLARIAALEDRLERREKQDATTARFNDAIAQLEAEGIDVDAIPGTRDRVAKFAAMGEEATKEVVALLKENATRDSSADLTALAGKVSSRDPAEVSKFADSPGKLAKAREFSATYDRITARFGQRQTREEFVAINMARWNEAQNRS